MGILKKLRNLFFSTSRASDKPIAASGPADRPVVSKGQVWSYQTRKGEEQSMATVLAVEPGPDGKNMVHLNIAGLSLVNAQGEQVGSIIEHVPMAEDAFWASVVQPMGSAATTLGEGYYLWKADFERNEAGIWDIPLAQVITLIEKSIP